MPTSLSDMRFSLNPSDKKQSQWEMIAETSPLGGHAPEWLRYPADNGHLPLLCCARA